MSQIDLALLDKYPYLDLTVTDLEQLFADDPLVIKHRERIRELEAKQLEYDARIAETHKQIEALLDQRTTLQAALRSNDTETRETRGRLNSDKYHLTLTGRRIEERGQSIAKRHKLIFRQEVNRRLARMGRELKLGLGRRAQKGLGTDVVEIDSPIETMG